MKKSVLIVVAMLLSAFAANAQDIITRKDGSDIKAKVLEVGDKEIRYRMYDEPDGAVYVAKKSDLVMVKFESGRNEVFDKKPSNGIYYTDREPLEDLTPGMRYKELKALYNFKEYTPALVDRYSTGWSGVASFFIPGLGQMICNEVGRGFAFLGGAVGGSLLAQIAYASDADIISSVLSLGVLAVDVVAIVDAVRVAKVKNMYEQDLRKTYSFDFDLHPSVQYIPTGSSMQATAGLTLALRF